MAQYTYVDIDPTSKKPLQQKSVVPVGQQNQQTQQQQQPGQFDIEKFAADSATRQMLWAYQRGMKPTQGDYEEARKAAYQQAFETQRQMQLEQMRSKTELSRQETMREFQEFGPRNMSQEEVKDASGLLSAHNQIMMLYHQNQDIPENDLYRTTATGWVAKDWGQAMDPKIRLYEATRGGSIISLGRGLLQDTGQVAGKEEAQTLIKKLMPGPGDSPLMAARKSADMIQMEMNGLQAKIQALPKNVDSTPLKNAYKQAYYDYGQIVNQYGSDSQKNFAPPSPKDLWGEDVPGLPTINKPAPAVQGGVSQATSDTLTAQAAGKPPLGNQATYKDIPSPGQSSPTPAGYAAPPDIPVEYPKISSEGQPYGTTPDQPSPSGQVAGTIAQNVLGLLPPTNKDQVDAPAAIGSTLERMKVKPGGPDDPSLTMPPGSQGPTVWGQ